MCTPSTPISGHSDHIGATSGWILGLREYDKDLGSARSRHLHILEESLPSPRRCTAFDPGLYRPQNLEINTDVCKSITRFQKTHFFTIWLHRNLYHVLVLSCSTRTFVTNESSAKRSGHWDAWCGFCTPGPVFKLTVMLSCWGWPSVPRRHLPGIWDAWNGAVRKLPRRTWQIQRSSFYHQVPQPNSGDLPTRSTRV